MSNVSQPRRSARIQARSQPPVEEPVQQPTTPSTPLSVARLAAQYEKACVLPYPVFVRRELSEKLRSELLDFKLYQINILLDGISMEFYTDPLTCKTDMNLMYTIYKFMQKFAADTTQHLDKLLNDESEIAYRRAHYAQFQDDEEECAFLHTIENEFREDLVKMEARLTQFQRMIHAIFPMRAYYIMYYIQNQQEKEELQTLFTNMKNLADSLRIRRVHDTDPLYGKVLEYMQKEECVHWHKWMNHEPIVEAWCASQQ
jgi:hypothetical protein